MVGEIKNTGNLGFLGESTLAKVDGAKLWKKYSRLEAKAWRLAEWFHEFWTSLNSNEAQKKALAKQVVALAAKGKNIGRRLQESDPALLKEAAKVYLIYFLNHGGVPKNLPYLVKAAKRELAAQFPKIKSVFDERFILDEVGNHLSQIKSEELKKNYKVFSYAKQIEGNRNKILRQIEKGMSKEDIEGLLDAIHYYDMAKPSTALKLLETALISTFKRSSERSTKNGRPLFPGKKHGPNYKPPLAQMTLVEDVIDYPINSAKDGQPKLDYPRSPLIFIDGELYCAPKSDDLAPKIKKKYGPLAPLLITQGIFGFSHLAVWELIGGVGVLPPAGQELMTYSIKQKGKMVQFNYKICRTIYTSEEMTKDNYKPACYIPAEMTVLFPLDELKNFKPGTTIDKSKVKVDLEIYPSVPDKRHAYDVLHMPVLTPRNAKKVADDYDLFKVKDEGKINLFLDTITELLTERGLSGSEDLQVTLSRIKEFLKPLKDREVYQPLLEKIKSALASQNPSKAYLLDLIFAI